MTTDCIIHIVDDETSVRASLAFLLMSSGYAVQAHVSSEAFLAAAQPGQKAVLVTDLRMPDMNGIELISAMRGKGLSLPAIVVTGHGDVPMAVAAMRVGAVDFIEKPFGDDIIIDAIERAALMVSDLPGGVADSVVRERVETLTAREREVLVGLVNGLANKTIAYDLDISPRTVEVHRANVMGKMQAKSLADLVRMSLSLGDIVAGQG